MANFADLQAQVDALSAQVAKTVGVEASAKALILGFGDQMAAAVTAALEADNAADDNTIASIKQVMADVTKQFSDSADDLGSAVVANPGTPPVTTAKK